ncbi:ZmpA/ZmpB/ZmpC family metallo-endopeptidase [Streptococcus suis]|uniref:Putative IgA-specific zinc metalloproteinase n=4 Tax=Streptococcus suis TaxID=1307 RepID=A0A116NK07_STRSU|nr:ZmpA/ZmpB/ZmpC family metallo-endopeptidase [Streptococcus suis]NQG69391.1 YSIRK-type signal peptide-containing protein [Streptococcus suis]NQH00532.1 YSIRK-type signal peptide-containing protein [Streptococcus suis]RRR59460.1 YSIRK-type signal peptide-containing protein [Streptococcus suis]CYV65863.1 putative IgA-specific zinc metalloproteinase [Streptococcus suis]CYW07091.1 putative IgA-specific zinc metalloproteinase [Streptococcus suis]
MKNIFGEKRQRFGFRKLSIGLVSAAVASLFFASSVAAAPSASAQSINYSYVTEQELTDAEKELIIRDLPGLAQETDANYYLIYRPATGTASTSSTSTSQVLPNTGSVETGLLVAGGVSLLLLAVRFGKKGKKELAGVILLTATGASFLGPTSSALTSQILAQYNHAIEISAGQALPAPAEIDGYVYVGYLKDSKAIEQPTSEEEKTAEFPASEGIRTETIVNKTEAIPFEIQTVENPQLSEGTERVVQEGQDGERTVTIKQVHSKGQIISEEEISSTVTKTAVPKIVEVGTKQATDDIVTEVPDTAPSHELPTLQITEEVSTYTESIPFETQEVADDTLLEGTRQIVQEGKAGQKTIETKKTYIDGILVKTETVSETINQTATPQIIHVGTKPVTSVPDSAPSHEVPTISLTEETLTHTEAIAFDVQEIYDANLAEGSREVEQKGQAGVRTIETKNYYADGVLIKSEQVSDVVTKAPVTEVVRVGTKTADVLGVETVVATEEIPFETTVTETEELYVGEEKVVNEGKVGSKEVTATYQTINGVRQPNPTVIEKVLEEPTTKEVLKGTKPIEGTESDTETVDIAFETEYVDDPTLLEGRTKVVTTGVNGSKTVTTTYQTIKGVRQENPTVTEEITKQPVKQVIARGTKVEKVPQVIITDLVENDDAKSATISYKLTDESANFQRAVALLYDNTGALVQEQAITDPNGQLTLENLDFYTDYTVKTKIFYTMAEQEQSSEQEAVLESMRKFDLVYKKIEIKDIDAVTVYRRKNGSYIGQEFLEELPTTTDELFIKVTSDRFKEVYLPVSSIEETTLNGKAVFKLVSSFDELVQDKDAKYIANREFYIPKMATDANTYTSFKALIDAMKANPKGTFKLGAHLDASEVPVGDVASYVTNFSGTLDGLNDGYAFSISNLKAPLFFNLGGKVQNLDIKNASLNTTSKNPLATIAINANGATITNVAVEASLKGPQHVSGLVHSATNSTIKDVSFKGSIEVTGTEASLTGGILGNGTMASVGNAKVDATITLPGTANQVAGGIVGRTMLVYDVPGSVYNSYATGSIVTTESAAIVGGIAGANQVTGAYAPYSGNVNNVISDMTGETSIIGQPANPNGKIKDGFTTTSDSLSNVTVITDEEAQAKVETMNIQATIDDSVPLNLNHYSVDYLTLDKAQADHEIAYYNMEKILPFYNKELLVYYGNKIATDDKLNKVRLLDVVPMKDNVVVADVYAEKANINKIMLHYTDGTVDYKTVSYLEDFKNNHVVEYTISGTDLIYTPESFLNDRSALVNDLVSSLSTVVLDSDAMKAIINYPTKLNADTQTGTAKDFYFGESFEQVKANLESNVRKILVASLNGQGQASEDYIKEKITNNKEAFVLGLTYLNRWYDINFGEMNTKDLTIFEPDFFGNDAASALDMILAIGNGGYDVLRAHNNVTTFASIIGKQNKQTKLFDMLEDYRQLFLPEMTNNDWFKQTTKAYVVEGKSLIPEVAAKQETTDTYSKYNVGAYSKIVNDTVSNPTWKYNHMLLPLLTLPQENIFIITNMNTIAIGSYEHYVDDYSTVENRDKVRQMVDLAAERQRDNADFWYKMLDETNRDKLFRSVLNNEGYVMYGKDGTKSYRNLTADVDAIQDFYGPINKWYREHPSIKTAFADGSETYYITYDMLTDYGTALYTHEMVHNQDGDIYLKGYGRRIGQGMEVYAQGLLQNVFNVTEMNLGFNAVYNSDDANRVHVGDPVARFNSEADFNEYYHNQFDVLYLLDYLEGTNILAQSDAAKKAWLRKIENYYVQNNGVDTHAGNSARALTDDEVASLKTFNDLIDQSIIVQRQYVNNTANTSKKWDRNSYVSVPMFAANFSALSNSKGSPGDIMFRRMAFELIAAKGYTDGFVPYASGQLSDLAMEKGSKIYDTWTKKDVGLITDNLVLDYVFQGQYTSWADFKKAMFTERLEKAAAGKLKPFTMQYELGVANSTKEVTITSFEQLQNLMKEAMEADIQANSLNLNNSRVHALKVKVYQALMSSTNDFRTSIFN